MLSGLSLYLTVAERVSASRESDVRAALGNKESVAFVAQQLATGGWSSRGLKGRLFPAGKHHERLLRSLCLAAVFEKSDRATALLYGCLQEYAETRPGGRKQIEDELARIDEIFRRYEHLLSLTEQKSQERLKRAQAALGAGKPG